MINALTAPNANPAIVTGITWVHHSGGSCPVPVTAHSVANPAIAAGSPGQQTTVTRDPARSSGNVSARSTRRVRGEERSEEHTSELQSRENLVCRLLLEKKKQK